MASARSEREALRERVPADFLPAGDRTNLQNEFEEAHGGAWTDDMPSTRETITPVAEVTEIATSDPDTESGEPPAEEPAEHRRESRHERPDQGRESPDRRAGGLDLDDDDSDERSRVHRVASEHDRRTHERAVGLLGEETNTVHGAMATGILASAAAQGGALEQRRRKERSDRSWLLRQLARRIGDLQKEIAAWQALIDQNNQEITQIDGEMAELAELRLLVERGELDPSDPEHARLLEAYGIDPALERDEMLEAIDAEEAARAERRTDLERQNEELREKIGENERKLEDLYAQEQAEIERAVAAGGMSPEAAAEIAAARAARAELRRENRQDLEEQLHVQATGDVDDFELETNDGLASGASTSLDEEVGAFFEGLAEAAQIEDPTERLARERELVEGLSDEAAYEASMHAEAEALFADGYFDALDAEPGGAEDEPALRSAPAP